MSRRLGRFAMELLEDRTVPAVATAENPFTTTQTSTTADVENATVDAKTAAEQKAAADADPEGTYVKKLYQDLLGRTTDVGAQGYIDKLNSHETTRRDVAEAILHSDEYAVRSISGMFTALLDRPADEKAIEGYVQEFRDGKQIDDVAAQIMSSDEYRARHSGAASYIDGIYQDLLGRKPDAESAAKYADRVGDDAASAQVVVTEIIHSKESRTITGEAVVGLMTRGQPAAGGTDNKYVKDAVNGKKIDEIIADFASSASYSNLGKGAATFTGTPSPSSSY